MRGSSRNEPRHPIDILKPVFMMCRANEMMHLIEASMTGILLRKNVYLSQEKVPS